MKPHITTTYRYCIDGDDKIIGVDHWWLAFARENGAANLRAASVVGRCIWDYVAGESTRSFYRELNEYVRKTGNSITVPFRCDSPTLRRKMELTINSRHDGSLLYESQSLRVKTRRKAINKTREKQSSSFLTSCSLCRRSWLEPFGWLDLPESSSAATDSAMSPEFRYEICPDCAQQCQLLMSSMGTDVIGEQRH